MALTDSNGTGMYMPVAPAYGGNFGGFGGWGDDAWIILILLFAMGGWGGFGGMGGFGGALGYDFPWLLNGQQGINANTNAGFNQAATASGISSLQNSITSGFGDVQLGIAGVNQNICSTGNGIVSAVNGAQNALAQQMYTNQISDLERSFAAQTANTQGLTALQGQLAQCCCDNRLATCQTQNIVQNESNATRFADANNTRDIIDSQTRGTQAILDKLCSLELDAKNDKIAELQTQVNMQNLAASQAQQTAQLIADNTAQTQYVVNRIAPYPVPSYNVPNPYGCNGFYGFNG